MLGDALFASTFLPCLSGPDNSPVAPLQNMLYANIQPQLDPFLYSCLHCIRSHHLMNLHKKSRIHVADGAVLMGGINELGHKNVVLFGQHGERPEADKMSGSDLDGDQFVITWDRQLFLVQTSEPMDYSPAKKSYEGPPICNDTLLQHFIDHACKDNLGQILMLWIDNASIKKMQAVPNVFIAVDFPKSAVPIIIPKELVLNQSVLGAHWHEQKGLPSFHCKSKVIAVAGHYGDSNRDKECIFKSKKMIFDPMFARLLGRGKDKTDIKLLDFAENQRNLYKSQ
eukprot:CCRYP_014311-RA/>CCRYP_014311-RA protein AED:0.47 eAED:0.47 QI:0/0/0/1/0/0/4/0/282